MRTSCGGIAIKKDFVSVTRRTMRVLTAVPTSITKRQGGTFIRRSMQDKIHLPTPGSFQSEYAFNATALHELSHSTGHPNRLNRPQGALFGTPQYAYEELVAEMCSCFMGVDLDVTATPQHLDNHKAYVQAWIQSIRDKPETLIRAIKDAQAAATYMDYKAGLITDMEYERACGSVLEVKQKERGRER